MSLPSHTSRQPSTTTRHVKMSAHCPHVYPRKWSRTPSSESDSGEVVRTFRCWKCSLNVDLTVVHVCLLATTVQLTADGHLPRRCSDHCITMCPQPPNSALDMPVLLVPADYRQPPRPVEDVPGGVGVKEMTLGELLPDSFEHEQLQLPRSSMGAVFHENIANGQVADRTSNTVTPCWRPSLADCLHNGRERCAGRTTSLLK